MTTTGLAGTETATDDLDRYGLGWLRDLRDAPLYHTDIAIAAFGRKRYDEIIAWMTEASVYPQWLMKLLFDDFIAYRMARATLTDLNEPLVIAVLPDFAQHLFLTNTAENRALDLFLANAPIDHDTAGTTTPLGSFDELDKTIRIFEAHGIRYHLALWQDYLRFTPQACLIKSGITAIPL